jgi:hypothetical protein
MSFHDDINDTGHEHAVSARTVELPPADARLLERLAVRLQLEPAAVVRVALLVLDQPRGRRWA